MESTLQNQERKATRELLNYYIDDENIPEGGREKEAYLGRSRGYLTDLVISGYRYLKAKGLEEQYWEWKTG